MPGRSLCKLGFPFQRIDPSFDDEANRFVLPPGSVPVSMMPLEGMFLRVVNTVAPGHADDPNLFIETSTPALIGQMGGPVFDSRAVVWGLLSHTLHHPLGFQPRAPTGHVEHQFLNCGLAVHVSVIRRILDAEGINYKSEDADGNP